MNIYPPGFPRRYLEQKRPTFDAGQLGGQIRPESAEIPQNRIRRFEFEGEKHGQILRLMILYSPSMS